MKKLILLTTAFALSLSAGMIKENELEKIQKQKEKSSLEAELTKDSWISPVTIEADITKSKGIDNSKATSKKAYLNLNQDIFRSGGIYYTIKKGEISKRLSSEQFDKNLSELKVELFKTVLNLKVLDLQIKKQNYLIKNKTLEIEKKQEQYLNSLIDIEELDQAVIDKNDLLNAVEDLKASKYEQEKNLKKYTTLPYEEIDVKKLDVISLETYLEENQNLVIQKLNSQISKYDQKIKNSSYLPKVSIFSQVGYEDNDASKLSDDYYNYGVKVSIPLDFNMNKNKEIARVNYLLSKVEESIKRDDEEQKHKAILKKLKSYDKKIQNANLSIKKYESIYAQTNELYASLLKTKQDLETIKNRLNSSRLDIKIFNLQKDIQVYELYKSLIKI